MFTEESVGIKSEPGVERGITTHPERRLRHSLVRDVRDYGRSSAEDVPYKTSLPMLPLPLRISRSEKFCVLISGRRSTIDVDGLP